jgi:hypothetical protein
MSGFGDEPADKTAARERQECPTRRRSLPAAIDPDPVVHYRKNECLVLPEAAIPLSGSHNDHPHDR